MVEPRVLVAALAELADLEEELFGARAKVERRDRRRDHLRELDAELEQDALEAEGSALGARAAVRRRELELRSLEESLARKRDQVIGVSDRRQHRALLDEIAALEKKVDELETSAIEALDASEHSDEDAAAAREERRLRAERSRDELEALAGPAEQAARAVAGLEREIARVLAALPADVARHVGRLKQRYPRAVVRVTDGACGGCFGQLPPQAAADAERGSAAVRCPSCARFVVHRPWNVS